MPALPDKFSLGARLPQNTRSIAAIKDESPLYAAGQGVGNAIAKLGMALDEKNDKDKNKDNCKPADGALALSRMQTAIDTSSKDFEAAPDPAQAGINGADYLDQSRAQIESALSAQDRARFGPSLEAMSEAAKTRLGKRLDERQREQRISDVTDLFPQLVAQHAAFPHPTIRQELGAAMFGAIDRLLAAGDIDEARAQAMKLDLQRQIVEADVRSQTADWRVRNLRPGQAGADPWFRQVLGKDKADLLLHQALQEQRGEEREKVSRDLLDAYGTGSDGERKALTVLSERHGEDAALQQLYRGKLQVRRRQERRDLAQSALNAYQLAAVGRANEIDLADRKRLQDAGQMDGLLDAAQYGRSVPFSGELLFKERFQAMGEEERALYGVADLAKRLSPQDFLEVMQGASGEIDEGQRARMQGFVQAVTPMLRSVTVGQYATAQEKERDRRLLGLVHEEVQTLVTDEEKKLDGRTLTAVEYQEVMRRAAYRALARNVNLEIERHGPQWLNTAPEVE